MRGRGVLLFLGGVLTGGLLFYSVVWRTGGIAPGHWLARTSRDLVSPQGPTLPPVPTIPFPTATPASAPASFSAPVAATPVLLAAGSVPGGPPGIMPAAAAPGFPIPDLGPLLLPVHGAKIADLKNNFDETRDGSRRHDAIDILAPRGTPVYAVTEGTIAKLFTSQQGGLTVYQFGRDGAYCYYYAHLERYAPGLAEGQALRRGDPIGEVGTSGNAPRNTPHLHFAIFRLGPARKWWQGDPVNPYPLLLKAEER